MLVARGLLPSWGFLGGLLGGSWGLLGRVLGPLGRVLGLPWASGGPGGGSRGAPEAENTVKPTYFHVFCRVSRGAGDPPKFGWPAPGR